MKKTLVDLTGKRFGRLVVKSRGGPNRFGGAVWLCSCDCGAEKVIAAKYLKDGQTVSCGCHKLMRFRSARKHGQAMGGATGAYKSWTAAKARCYRETHQDYPDYGGRGIMMSERWLTFSNFYADMGERLPGMTLGRKDNAGNYCKENCRWESQLQQASNKRNNRHLDFRGQRKTVAGWARELGHDHRSVRSRIESCGWSVERALTTYTPAQISMCDG